MTKRLITFIFSLFIGFSSFTQVYWEQMGQDLLGDTDKDEFGRSVDMSADGLTVIVGEPVATTNFSGDGLARVFMWDSALGGWVQMGQDLVGEAATDGFGISVAISDDGNTVAVGATTNDDGGTAAGHVRVFDWDGSAWIQRGNDIDGKASSEGIGLALSLSGDGNTLAFGQDFSVVSLTQPGLVRAYTWDGSSWVQQGSDIFGENAGDKFGNSISLSDDGNIMAVGAHENDGFDTGAGHVRVFEWDGTNWNQKGSDVDGEFGLDKFGISVSLTPDGNTFVAGAPRHKYTEGTEGRVRVFDWDGSDWVMRGNHIQGEYSYEQFGFDIDITDDGNRYVVSGPRGSSPSNELPGRVEVNDWDGTEWSQLGADQKGDAIGEQFGESVACSSNGSIYVVGADKYVDGNGDQIGRAQIYRLCGENPPVPDVADLPDVSEECELSELTAPTATDDCDHSITATHDATLPITTTTTVTWTYTDAAGNTTTQTQEVLVSPCPIGVVENEANLITLYPNPTRDMVNITTNDKPVNLTLTTLSGQVLLNKENIYAQHTLDLSHYTKGLYVLTVFNSDGKTIYKVIKK